MKSGKSRGRPAFTPDETTRKAVQTMASCAVPVPRIAEAFGVSENTLRKHFRDELEKGALNLEVTMITRLHGIANDASNSSVQLRAVIWILQTRFGWSRHAPRPKEQEMMFADDDD